MGTSSAKLLRFPAAAPDQLTALQSTTHDSSGAEHSLSLVASNVPPPQETRQPLLRRRERRRRLLTAIIMGGLQTCIVTGTISLLENGFTSISLAKWMLHWIKTYPIAVLVIYCALPHIRWLVRWLTRSA